MVAQVARDRQATAPGERPVRQGGVRVARLHLDGVPERQDLIGQVQPDLLDVGERPKACLAKDEGAE